METSDSPVGQSKHSENVITEAGRMVKKGLERFPNPLQSIIVRRLKNPYN